MITLGPATVLRQPHDSDGAVLALQFSPFRKELLAAASSRGDLDLWNTETRELEHSFSQAHSRAITGVCFSPVNNMLLCSVGLDGCIVFHDVIEHKTVKQSESDDELTCLTFSSDGFTAVAGTQRGAVNIYDLRREQMLKATFDAMPGDSIRAVHFALSKSTNGRLKEVTQTASTTLTTTEKPQLPPASPGASRDDSMVASEEQPQTTSVSSTPATSAQKYAHSPELIKTAEGPDHTAATAVLTRMEETKESTTTDAGALSREPIVRTTRQQTTDPYRGAARRLEEHRREASGVTAGLQAQLVRSVVEECLLDFKLSLHRDVQSMHVDLIRQFEIQKKEMQTALEKLSVNSALVEEVERLRAENASLRARF